MSMRQFSQILLVILCLLLVLTLSSCGYLSGGGSGERAMSVPAGGPAPAAPPQATVAKEAAGSADAVTGGEADSAAPAQAVPGQRRIITTGSMTLEVISMDKALSDLTALVNTNGGFIANKSVSSEGNWRTAEVTVRVPADKFDALHDGARGLGTVKREDQQGEDVTKQWQDLDARLKIRKQEEQSLLALMQKQAKLSDLLAVEQRLWQVREQIEQAEGELRYLRDQVALATLTITLNEQVPVGVERIGRWNLGYHFLHAIYAMGRMLRGLVVGLIYVALPGAIIWVPLLLLALWIRRRVREKRERRGEE